MSEHKQIGVYRVVKTLGGGGMGVVYLVEDTESGGLYALKLLSPSLSPTEREVRRFRREFMTMSRLRHPKIVEVYESGFHDSSLFFVMEYVQGMELRKRFLPFDYPEHDEPRRLELLRKINQPQNIEQVLNTFMQICEALAWIHSFGIVHRDLKPENILISSNNQVKLLDFGIAKRLGSPEVSQAHSIMGTFSYISPEQAQCEDVDGRSDLYSLGVILYELLAGRPPFVAPEPIGRLYMHLNKPAPPLREWNPQVDPMLEQVVLTLLEKDPLDRYQRAEDLHAALSPFLQKNTLGPAGTLGGISSLDEKTTVNPKFVGRQQEHQSLMSSLQEQREPLVLLSGNTGMGKTRMAREFLSSVRVQQVECCSVRCQPETPPYSAYQELMEQLRVGVFMRFGNPNERWGEAGSTWFSMMSAEDSETGMDTLPSTGGNAEREKLLLFQAARQILEQVLQRVPVVFFLDDVMFVDEVSLELTEYLAREIHTAGLPHPFLLLGAFRNEDVDMEHPLNQLMLRLAPERLYKLYDLKPLQAEHVKEMAATMVGLPPAEDSLQILMEQSQGIPFFVEELLKAWFEEGQLLESEDGWYLLVDELEEEEAGQSRGRLPLAIRKRLCRRLDRLSENTRVVAQWVSVLGQEASFDLMLELSGFSEAELLSCLDELIQQKLVLEDWSSGTERYQFSHPGIQEALYLQIEAPVRQKFHLQVAQSLKRSASREGSFELLAHHFLSAGEDEQGAWYMLLAAEQQLRAFAHRSAWELLDRCRQLLSKSEDDVLFQSGASWWWRYHHAYLELMELTGHYKDGLELAQYALQQLSGNEEASALLRWQAVFFRQMGSYQEALDCVQRALAWGVDEHERLYLLQEGGRIYRAQGRYGAALEAYREALAWAVSRQKFTEEGRLSGMIGQVLFQRGEFAEAREHFLKCMQVAIETDDQRGEADALCKLGALELDEGDIPASLERFEKAVSLARELGDRRMECTALSLLGQLQSDRRLYDDGLKSLELALQLALQLGDLRMEGELQGRLGALNYFMEQFQTARRHLEEGLQKVSHVGDRLMEIWIRCYLNAVELVLRNRSREEVLEELQKTLRLSEEMEAMEIVLLCKLISGHLYRLLNERELSVDQLIAARYLAIKIGNRRLLAKIESERYLLDRHKGLVWGDQRPEYR